MDKRYFVFKDTREKLGWDFSPSKTCQGMTLKKLDEGDYTIEGFEDKVVIERKGSLSEFANNLIQERFYRELDRLEKYPYAFIVLEFALEDIFGWPHNSMPPRQAQYCKTSPYFLLKKISEIQLKYKTKIIFAGGAGQDVSASIFREVINADNKS